VEAEKEMRMAMPWWQPPFNAIDSKIDFDKWAKTRIPEHIEDARKNWTEINADPPFSHRITEAEFGEHERNRLWRDEQPPQSKVDPKARQKQIEATRGLWNRIYSNDAFCREHLKTDADRISLLATIKGSKHPQAEEMFLYLAECYRQSTAPGRSFPNSTDLLSVGHLIQKE
jgi:hypothetical protein